MIFSSEQLCNIEYRHTYIQFLFSKVSALKYCKALSFPLKYVHLLLSVWILHFVAHNINLNEQQKLFCRHRQFLHKILWLPTLVLLIFKNLGLVMFCVVPSLTCLHPTATKTMAPITFHSIQRAGKGIISGVESKEQQDGCNQTVTYSWWYRYTHLIPKFKCGHRNAVVLNIKAIMEIHPHQYRQTPDEAANEQSASSDTAVQDWLSLNQHVQHRWSLKKT